MRSIDRVVGEENPKINRKLGANERITWLGDQAGSINFVIVARISGHVDEQILRTALDMLSRRHPLLKARVELQEGEPAFVSENVPRIPLRVEVRRSDDHWHAEAEKEIDCQLPWSTGPLVRVVLLKSFQVSEVLITFHHVIGDGMSAVYLMRDLLEYVGQLTAGVIPHVLAFPGRPSVEELLSKSAKNLNGLAKTVKLMGKQLVSIVIQHPRRLPTNTSTVSENHRAHVIHYTLSTEETCALTTRCHKESTTVHGALCAALLKAAANQICDVRSEEKSVAISCMSAVDLRRFLDPPLGDEIGFFISMAVTTHRISKDTEFWSLARNAKEEVHKSIENGEPLVFLSLLDRILPKNAASNDLVKRINKIYPSAMIITNLGRLDIPERYGPLVLQEVHFAVANKTVPEHFNAAIITYRSRLFINFSYTEPTLSHERATTFAEDAIGTLKSALYST